MEKKRCTKCKTEKTVSEFYSHTLTPDGYCSWCKVCKLKKAKEWRDNNQDKVKARAKRYYSENISERKKYEQTWRKKNEDKISVQKKEYRENNKEKIKKTNKDYFLRNKEKILEYKRKWRNKNIDKERGYRKKSSKKLREYLSKKYKEDILYRLKVLVRGRLQTFLRDSKFKKTSKTFDIVDCTPQELKEHLEKQFRDGMSWENRNEWHIDHIIPLCSATTEDELYKLCHYTNLQPLWATENIKKGGKIL